MIWIAVVGAALLGAADFEATTLDGRTATGQLVELNDQRAVLETAGGRETFALESLAVLVRGAANAEPAKKAALVVELVDGSRLAASDYMVTGPKAHVTLSGGAKLEIPTRVIRWVRFASTTSGDAPLDEQWVEITQTSAGGDLLVVRKDDQLDYLEGIVGDVDADRCQFEIDDDVVPVKRAKIEGFVYFHPAAADLDDVAGSIITGDGSRIVVAKATLGDGNIKLSTPAGTSLNVPLDEVTRLDFTTGKIAYLSDLDPAGATYEPLFGFRRDVPVLNEFFGYRRDQGFENSPLELDGKQFRKGLALQSRTVLSYRLPRAFRRLRATVGIEDRVRATGNAKLSIAADGQTVWEGDVRGGEPPREIDVQIDGARRLQIVADYGDEQDVGDRIVLGNVRVTK